MKRGEGMKIWIWLYYCSSGAHRDSNYGLLQE